MRRLWVPAISTLVMLVILVSLGVWQLQRRAWKHDLVARIESAEALPAVPLPAEPDNFAKVHVSGHLRTDLQARYGAELRGDTLGAKLIIPMERPGADPVLVDLGWLPNDRLDNLALPQDGVDGFVRPAEHATTFSGKDDPAQHLFYTLDPGPIGASLGLAKVAPFTLVAIGTVANGVFPIPATELPRPVDNHLQYALTWFGFAITLLIIFIVYARKALRP